MKNKLLFIICSIFIVNLAIAQEKQVQQSQVIKRSYTYQPHWSFGGNVGLSFWNGGTDILLAPKAYYHLTPKFLTGFGITYIYSDYDGNLYGYHSNSIGASVMAAVRPVNMLQLSVEYEGLQTNRGGYLADEYWNNALYLGAAFVAGRVSFGFQYDVLYDSYKSVYGSAWTPVIGFYF